MKNQSRITVDRMQELQDLIEQIKKESYNQGYEDGKEVMEFSPQVEKVVEKSANQKRAELIEKAKLFVEGKLKFYYLLSVEFVIKNNRVTCLIDSFAAGKRYLIGRSDCNPDDVFNEWIGKAIALARALEIDIPVEFLEAVQPSEVVVGQTVTWNVLNSIYDILEKDNHKYSFFSHTLNENINELTYDNLLEYCKITNDTHAEY